MRSSDEYEAIAETLEVLQDDGTLEALRESERDVREGRVYPIDQVRRDRDYRRFDGIRVEDPFA